MYCFNIITTISKWIIDWNCSLIHFVFETDITSTFAGAAFKLFRYHCCYCILICTKGLYTCEFLCNPTKALQSHKTGNLFLLQACKMNTVKTILQRPRTVTDIVFNVTDLKNCVILPPLWEITCLQTWNQDRWMHRFSQLPEHRMSNKTMDHSRERDVLIFFSCMKTTWKFIL